jgi:hypothetical protein
MITYEPYAGELIGNACQTAVTMANESNDTVKYNFNGIELFIPPGSNPSDIVNMYHDLSDKRYKNRESPKGIQAKKDRDAEIKRNQATIDKLCQCQQNLLATEDMAAIMAWLREFTDGADDNGVTFDKMAVYDAFIRNGYRLNAHVGRPREDFTNKTVMAEYIIGQAMSCLASGMPPHPVALKFIDDYFSVKGTV